MIDLRCPDCWFQTGVDETKPFEARCIKCGADLNSYYFKGKTHEDTAALAIDMNERFRVQAHTLSQPSNSMPSKAVQSTQQEAIETTGEAQSDKPIPRKHATKRLLLFSAAVVGGLMTHGYLTVKMLANDIARQLLNDNHRSQAMIEGISVPISVLWDNAATITILLRIRIPRDQASTPTVSDVMRNESMIHDSIPLQAEIVSTGVPLVGHAFGAVSLQIPYDELIQVPFDRAP